MMGPAARAVLERLADGRGHSGEQLAEALGISRAAVWKHVRSIRGAGIEVLSAPGRGYRLEHPLELLDAARIRRQLRERAGRRRIEVLPEVDSTNRWLTRRGVEGATSGSVCLAETQTAGRGRRGRHWVSPYGANLYLSMLWRFEQAPAALGGLSLAVAVAGVRALEGFGVEGVRIKWPNDLYWDGRKLAGALVEVHGESAGPCQAVVGMGLNLRMPGRARAGIDQPFAELHELPGGSAVGRNALAAALIATWDRALGAFAAEGLSPFLDRFRRLDLTRNREVVVREGDRYHEGIARGVDAQGCLRVSLPGGERCFSGGEVSVRLPAQSGPGRRDATG